MSGILVVGAGGHAKVVVATLQASGFAVAGCLDDAPGAAGLTVLGVPVLGPVAQLGEHEGEAVLAIGDNRARQQISSAHPHMRWATVVHPTAVVHTSVMLGAGTVVFAQAVVQPDSVVGRHVIVNTAATVDHDGRIGDFSHLAPGVHLSGGVTVGEGTLVGVGACIGPGRTVGVWAVVGAGAAVVHDLPDHGTFVGVPARFLARPLA